MNDMTKRAEWIDELLQKSPLATCKNTQSIALGVIFLRAIKVDNTCAGKTTQLLKIWPDHLSTSQNTSLLAIGASCGRMAH